MQPVTIVVNFGFPYQKSANTHVQVSKIVSSFFFIYRQNIFILEISGITVSIFFLEILINHKI